MATKTAAQAISFLTQVIKRDGSVKQFESGKIASALLRAGQASCEFGSAEAGRLTQQAVLQKIASDTGSPRKTASATPTFCRPAVLHQLVATAGRLHRRSVRGDGAAGCAAAQIHRRHRAASVHDRAAVEPTLAAHWSSAHSVVFRCRTSPPRRLFRSAPSITIWPAVTRFARNAMRISLRASNLWLPEAWAR